MGDEPKIQIKVDNKELMDFFEAWLEDFTRVSEKMLEKINVDRGATLKIPEGDFRRVKMLTEALDNVAKKKFGFENVPDFSPMVASMKRLEACIEKIYIPEQIEVKMPNIEFPAIPAPTIDFTPILQGFQEMTKLFQQGIPASITNFEQMPLVFEKTVGGSGATAGGGDATEATLQSILAAVADVVTNTAAISIDADSVNLNTDTLETLIAAGNASLASLAGAVYTEDSPHTTGDKGMLLLGVRDDGFTTFGANGDYIPIATNYQGAVKVIAGESAGLNIRALTNTDVVTVELSAVDNAVLDTIDAVLDTIKTDTAAIVTSVQTIDNAIAGSEMQVDVLTLPSLPAGTNGIGKLTANAGVTIGAVEIASAQTIAVTNAGTFLVQNVGNIAHDSPGTASAPMLMGGYASAAAPTSVNADGDAVRAWYLRNGAQATVLTAAGALIGGDAANGLDVDVTRLPTLANVTTVATLTNITNWGNIVDNAGFTDGTTRLMMNGYIYDEVAGTALTENDGAAARIDAKRAQVMVIEDVTTRGTTNRLAITSRLSLLAEGPTAADAAIAAAPMTVGGRASDAVPSAMSADGDVVNSWMGRRGETIVAIEPKAFGGCSIYRTIDLDETEEEVKSTAGTLYGWFIHNKAATTLYVKIYNATAASVTVGTTTPAMTIPIPAGASANVEYTNGIAFSTAICIAATTGVADADTGAPAANDVIMNVFYK